MTVFTIHSFIVSSAFSRLRYVGKERIAQYEPIILLEDDIGNRENMR